MNNLNLQGHTAYIKLLLIHSFHSEMWSNKKTRFYKLVGRVEGEEHIPDGGEYK